MDFESFKKRPGTSNAGKNYEDLMVAYLALELVLNKEVKKFALWSNDDTYGMFDDVIIEVSTSNGRQIKYALQLKHANAKRNLTIDALASQRGNFSIQKYFEDSKNKFSKEVKLILYTNQVFNNDGCTIKLDWAKIDVRIVKQQRFKELGNGSGLCYKFEIAKNENEVEGTVKEYEDFFQQFYLYTNQEGVDNLKKIVFQKFKDTFHDYISVERYLTFIHNWSQKDGNKIKLNMEFMKRVITMILVTPFVREFSFSPNVYNKKSTLFKQAISEFNITLIEESSFEKMQQLWWQSDTLLAKDQDKLRKIAGYFQITTDNLDDKLKSILAWLIQNSPLIVIESETVYNAITLCKNCNFIVIRDPQSNADVTNLKKFQRLDDLAQDSKMYKDISETFMCSIQGKEEITLATLVQLDEEFRNIVTTNELIKMLDGTLTIGNEKEKLPQPHIGRFLATNTIRYELLNNLGKDTLVVISCLNSLDLIKKHFKNFNLQTIESYLKSSNFQSPTVEQFLKKTIYYQENQCTRQDFDRLCKNFSPETRFHHLRVVDDNSLEWVYSKGSISDLEEYRTTHRFIEENLLEQYEEDNNVNVIIGDPGIGKSVLACNFKNNYKKTFWTLLFRVRDHVQHFQKILVSCSHSDLQSSTDKFMELIKGDIKSDFEKKVFDLFRNKNHLTLIWDGMDEISNKHLELTLRLIKGFSERGFKQWISSRSYLRKSLERRFNVLSMTIKRFDLNEQNTYISEQLNQLQVIDLEEISAKIKHYIKLVEDSDMLGIPLQIFMLTELFRQNPENQILSKGVFSISKLYQHFVDEKHNVYFKDKLNMQNKDSLKWMYHRCAEIHENVSLKTLLAEEILTQLDIDYDKLMDDAGTVIPIGIIIDITKDAATFLHLSYAEYFVAKYFLKKQKKYNTIIKNFIFQERYNNIRFMFDLLLAEDSKPHLAVLCRNMNVLENCPNYDLKDKGGRNLLHLACSWGARFPLVKSSETKGTFIINDDGCAVNENLLYYQKKLLTFLSDKCDPKKTDQLYDIDSFTYAEASLCLLPLEALLSLQGETDLEEFPRFSNICTVVYYAVKYDYISLLKRVKYIPLVQIQTMHNYTLLHLSALYNAINCVKLILTYYNHQEQKNYKCSLRGETPIFIACQYGHHQIVKSLINARADVDAADKNGLTPIYIACQNGYLQVVELLIKAKANVNTPNNYGFSPIYIACQTGHLQVVELLIKAEANINAANRFGATPFYAACRSGNLEIVKLLLNFNVNINGTNDHGNTPIQVAAFGGHLEIVQLLIDRGGDINACDNDEDTPLHDACANGFTDIVQLLTEHNANIHAKNNSGFTPLQLAQDNQHSQTVDFLLQKFQANRREPESCPVIEHL